MELKKNEPSDTFDIPKIQVTLPKEEEFEIIPQIGNWENNNSNTDNEKDLNLENKKTRKGLVIKGGVAMRKGNSERGDYLILSTNDDTINKKNNTILEEEEEEEIEEKPLLLPTTSNNYTNNKIQINNNINNIVASSYPTNTTYTKNNNNNNNIIIMTGINDNNNENDSNNNSENNLGIITIDRTNTDLLTIHNNNIKPNFKKNILIQLKQTIVAGTGFLCDAYDLFVINLVLVILQKLYKESSGDSSMVSTGALWGAVGGQIVFGFLADRIGRKIGFIITLSFIIVGAFASALSFDKAALNIFGMLTLWRTILGFGIGGEYPLSATISSESSSSDRKRGSQVASVFSMQGLGIILSPVVVVILLKICGPNHIDLVWRLALGFGGIPGLVMIYFRIKMKETKSFSNKAKIQKKQMFLSIMKYWKTLAGTAGGWFIFDITFYANGLFNGTIVSLIGFDDATNTYDEIWNTTLVSLYLALIGLPGYFVGIALIDRLGRKKLQMLGFALLGITYMVMGISYDHIVKIKALFIVLYGLTFFFGNAGPNTTTFVLPSESFPTKIRATCHGLSAAAGKIGAVIGGATIKPLFTNYGLGKTLIVCGAIAFVGLILTFFVVQETMGKPVVEDEDIQLDNISDDPSLRESTGSSSSGVDDNIDNNNNNNNNNTITNPIGSN
ncbi:hypothetical protein ACTFIV_011027 [Dictyostelium citrinum]